MVNFFQENWILVTVILSTVRCKILALVEEPGSRQ